MRLSQTAYALLYLVLYFILTLEPPILIRAAILGYNWAFQKDKKKRPPTCGRTSSPASASSGIVSHPIRVHSLPSPGAAAEVTQVVVVPCPLNQQSQALQSTQRSLAPGRVLSGPLDVLVTRFYASFRPHPVPLPLLAFAADEILCALIPLLLQLHALEAAFPLYDINIIGLVTMSHAAVVCTKAAIAACPVLATPAVTSVLAELTCSLRRVFYASCFTISTVPTPPQMIEDSQSQSADEAASPSTTAVVVHRRETSPLAQPPPTFVLVCTAVSYPATAATSAYLCDTQALLGGIVCSLH